MSDELTCGFCSENLESLTLSQREDHYEAHFIACGSSTSGIDAESSRRNATATAQRGKKRFQPSVRRPWKKLVEKIENDAFWYPSLGVPPPRNYSPGIIPILKQSLTKLCVNGKITRAVLCHEKVVHISKEFWDASWGCGYLNFLMLCTVLLEQEHQPLYFPLLDASPAPSVRNLQCWIQVAWENGYDVIGRDELRSKILGTNKWIGTAEIYIALSHRGIPAELLDFTGFTDKRSCATALLKWMVNYFTPQKKDDDKRSSASINDVLGKTTPVFVTRLPPVILQHRGHSRLIIGYQEDFDGTVSLLTFDTGRLLPQALRSLSRSPYGLSDSRDDRQEEVEVSRNEQYPRHEMSQTSDAAPQHEEQVTNSQRRPITLMELLTPSERELANGHMLTSEATQKEKESSKRAKFASHLKIKTSKNNKAPHDAGANNVGRPELDARQAQKSFKLTFQQLALNIEYQVLYVPLRPPLTEEEKLDRKVVKCQRISGNSMII